MSAAYVVRRVLLFFVVVWAATTFIFFLPKLAPGRNPIVERIGMMVATGGVNSAGMQSMVDAYEAKFGLNKPLWQQYLTYLGDLSHGDFGYSLMLYPTKVLDIILVSMPWTIGLLTVSTVIALIMIIPAGLLMGFGFPTGMRLVSAIDTRPTPWFWTINGAAGVLASSIAVAGSIAFSISVCIWLGAVCYLPLGITAIALMNRPASNSIKL